MVPFPLKRKQTVEGIPKGLDSVAELTPCTYRLKRFTRRVSRSPRGIIIPDPRGARGTTSSSPGPVLVATLSTLQRRGVAVGFKERVDRVGGRVAGVNRGLRRSWPRRSRDRIRATRRVGAEFGFGPRVSRGREGTVSLLSCLARARE